MMLNSGYRVSREDTFDPFKKKGAVPKTLHLGSLGAGKVALIRHATSRAQVHATPNAGKEPAARVVSRRWMTSWASSWRGRRGRRAGDARQGRARDRRPAAADRHAPRSL